MPNSGGNINCSIDIDYDFFEDGHKNTGNGSDERCGYSKIVTKAVIETKPKLAGLKNRTHEFIANLPTRSSVNEPETSELQRSNYNSNFECISSPTSSAERRMLENILNNSSFNCLAYSEAASKENSSLMLSNDKEFSSSSSSSIVTTFSSDLTSVSPMSSILISSFESDENNPLILENTIENNQDSTEVQNFEENDSPSRPNTKLSEEGVNLSSYDEMYNGTDHSNDNGDANDYLQPNSLESQNEVHNKISIDGDNQENPIQENSAVTNYSDDEYESDILSLEEQHYNYDKQSQESEEETNKTKTSSIVSTRKSSSSTALGLEEELGDISLMAENSSSKTSSVRVYKKINKLPSKTKKFNLTFSREEVIRIERDNLTLLKKIMKYSKPTSVLLNQSSSNKKSSTAINRARQQKKIEQDNYILYSKISAMSRARNVF